MNRTLIASNMGTAPANVYPKGPQKPGPGRPWPGLPTEQKACRRQVLAVLLLLALARICAPVAYLGAAWAHAALFWQLWGPMRRADLAGEPLAALGLHGHGWRQELLWAATVAAVVLPLWALGLAHLREPLVAAGWLRPRLALGLGWADGAELALTHIVGVALPEELFWRGYVQPVLEGRWPPPWRLGPIPFGPATLAACALFALGHVVGGHSAQALATALPALLFAGLKARRGSLVGAIALHGACNVAAAALT